MQCKAYPPRGALKISRNVKFAQYGGWAAPSGGAARRLPRRVPRTNQIPGEKLQQSGPLEVWHRTVLGPNAAAIKPVASNAGGGTCLCTGAWLLLESCCPSQAAAPHLLTMVCAASSRGTNADPQAAASASPGAQRPGSGSCGRGDGGGRRRCGACCNRLHGGGVATAAPPAKWPDSRAGCCGSGGGCIGAPPVRRVARGVCFGSVGCADSLLSQAHRYWRCAPNVLPLCVHRPEPAAVSIAVMVTSMWRFKNSSIHEIGGRKPCCARLLVISGPFPRSVDVVEAGAEAAAGRDGNNTGEPQQ